MSEKESDGNVTIADIGAAIILIAISFIIGLSIGGLCL